MSVKGQIEEKGLKIHEYEMGYIPKVYASLPPSFTEGSESAKKFEDFLDSLNNLDEVVRVHNNLP